jgi:DNA ligase-1
MSRNGKPYLATPHLNQNEVTLDGELYSHEYKEDFNKIVSLCKKQKPTPEELEEARQKVQYWIYDMPYAEGGFEERYETLKKWFETLPKENNPYVLVPTKRIKSKEELDEFHAENIAKGYEGTIIRRLGIPYEFKRSKSLLKYKDFKDEEFKIVGYEEGEGGRTGTIGFFIMQHDKNPNQTFKSNVKGNFDYLKQVWADRDSYIGKTATVKYFQRTPKKEDGGDVPRFPYIIKINREEYE